MVSGQCILAMELENIGREKIDGSLAKRQIHQYFPPSINCAVGIWLANLAYSKSVQSMCRSHITVARSKVPAGDFETDDNEG